MKRITYITLLCLLMTVSVVSAQENEPASLPGMRSTPSNLPDISVIGDIAGMATDVAGDPDRNKIVVRGVELALQGYIYPQMRADVFLAMHRHDGAIEPELCEASVSFLNILGCLGARAGKIHVDFGKINKIHQHERPYADQPLALTNFFGEHGLIGEGASVSCLMPLPFFLQAELGAWRIPSAHHHEGEEEEPSFGLADETYTGRLWASFSPGKKTELELGASGATGRGSHYLHHMDRARVAGGDVTLKYWPSTFTRLIIQAEALHLVREVPVGTLRKWGTYGYIGYQPGKYWEAGMRYDWTEDAFPDGSIHDMVSGMLAYKFTETTKLRLQAGYHPKDRNYRAWLQLVFGIGPHSHPMQ